MKCCDITPAMLKRKVSIQEKQTTTDQFGGESVAWVEVDTPWCMLKPLNGRERVYADRLNATGDTILTMRYKSPLGFDESAKVVYRGTEYQIRSIINLEEADRWLQLVLEKGVVQ